MHRTPLADHVENLFRQMNMPEEGRRYVRHVMEHDPSRIPKNHYGNVLTRYPSKKMGYHVFLESMAGELAKAIEYEIDENVEAYYSQPQELQVNYLDENGKRCGTGAYHPDFLVIRKHDIIMHEVRDDARLHAQVLSHPYTYKRDEHGNIHFMPAEGVCMNMGIPFFIIKNSSIDIQLVNNARFLIDYLQENSASVPPETLRQLIDLLTVRKYVPYMELLDELGFTADHVLSAIAGGYVDVNLHIERLDVPSDLIVCLDSATSAAVRAARQKELQPVLPLPGVMRLQPGTVIKYDNVKHTVVICGERELHVRDKDGHLLALPLEAVLDLNNLNAITSDTPASPPDAKKMLHDFDSAQWSRAEIRLQALEKWDLKKFSRSSLNNFASRVRGLDNQVDRFIALMDDIPKRGNHSPRFTNRAEIQYHIRALECYNAPERMHKRGAYAIYQRLLQHHFKTTGEFLTPRSYATFCKDCDEAEDILKREGEKAAYQKNSLDLFFALPFPVHGTRPFEVCYIDHTTIPLATTDLEGVDLGKPNITLAVDGATRKRLAFWLSYNPPSAASVLMVLRDMVRRHHRLPTILVVDNGKEFHSKELILFCHLHGIELRYRPPSQPRGGAIVERAFGATQEEVIQQLQGNTTNMIDPRMVSRKMYPFDRRIWTLVALYAMLNEYFKQYALRAHPALGMSPEEKEQLLYRTSGQRKHIAVRFDENLLLLTCPHTKRWFHKIEPKRGINLYGQYYWDPELDRNFKKGDPYPEVRVEPWDANVLYVCLKGHWVTAIVRKLSPYRGRTTYEVQQAIREGARAAAKIGKCASNSPEVLAKKADLFVPIHFDERLAAQQREMGHLAKTLGMSIASSAAAKFLERTTADNINSPFTELQWNSSPEVDSTAKPEAAEETVNKSQEGEQDSAPPQFDESTLRAFRNYL